jgi:Bacterial PH domain
MSRVRFRPHQAILVAAVIVFISALPLVFGPDLPTDPAANPSGTDTVRWWLTPILLVPVALFVWVLRSGTDADGGGLTLRAIFSSRRVPWSAVRELSADDRGRAVALLEDGHAVPLPQVKLADLPRLVAASGRRIEGPEKD